MEKIKVSIIVPVYNCEKSLKICIESIIKQTLKEIEIILVDDGSVDNSGVICDEYSALDKRITVIHQENKGAGKARNTGLAKAKGEYIGFVDSDDWIEQNMFEIMYNSAKTDKLDIIRCNTVIHEMNEKRISWTPLDIKQVCDEALIKSKIIPMLIAPEYEGRYAERLLKGCVCCIFLREMLKKNNIQFRDIRNGQDALFTIEGMWHSERLRLLPDVLYHYIKQESGSLSISMTKYRNYNQRKQSRKIIEDLVSNTKYSNIYQKRFEQEDRRFVYLDARIATIYNKDADKKDKIKLLKELLNSEESKIAFSKKINDKLPLQLYMLYFLIKHKMYRTLYYAINKKFKK